MQDPVTLVSQVAGLIKEGPDPLGLFWSERRARSYLNKTLTSQRTRRDAQAYLTELLNLRQRPAKQPIAKMPQKRKFSGPVYARAAKVKKVSRDKYGGKTIDWAAAAKLADAAAKTAVNRATETTYSQSGLYCNTQLDTLNTVGYSLSGINQSAVYTAANPSTRGDKTNGVLVIPVVNLAQVGNTNTPGYRKGQRINPLGFRVSWEHSQAIPTMNKTYHYAFIRNKGRTFTSITSPQLTTTDSMYLFVPQIQGPLVGAGGPAGNLPMGNFSSCMRWNRSEWNVLKHGKYTMAPTIEMANNAAIISPTNITASFTRTHCETVYIPIKDAHWDYPTPTAITDIKGGDYFFVMWSEGDADRLLGRELMRFVYELSFKDP